MFLSAYIIQLIDHDVIRSLKASHCSRMIQQIIKVTDGHKPIPKVGILDAMKMCTIYWKDIIVQKVFAKTRISAKD